MTSVYNWFLWMNLWLRDNLFYKIASLTQTSSWTSWTVFLILCLQYLSTFYMFCAVVLWLPIKINALHKGHSSVSLNLLNFANTCLNIFVWKELEYLKFMANQIGAQRKFWIPHEHHSGNYNCIFDTNKIKHHFCFSCWVRFVWGWGCSSCWSCC